MVAGQTAAPRRASAASALTSDPLPWRAGEVGFFRDFAKIVHLATRWTPYRTTPVDSTSWGATQDLGILRQQKSLSSHLITPCVVTGVTAYGLRHNPISR